MNKLFKIMIILIVIMYFNVNLVYSTSYIYKRKDNISSISTVANPYFTFESESQILIEPNSGKVLYENNADEKLAPASVTKVMTLLLLMEQIDAGVLDYSDTVTCSKEASQMGGSQIWFEEGETLTIDEALKAICVVSANDVTVAIAELIGGNEENFVIMMNNKAQKLGMNNTHFVNCHGIDADGHYSCARDIAIMAKELITKHPNILKYSSIWMDTLRGGATELSSTNKLIKNYKGATGLKTGYTSIAKYNLVATATRGDTTFISVIMKAPTSDIRLKETTTLLDYGFSKYESKKICSTNTILDSINVDKSLGQKLDVRIENDIFSLVEKGSKTEYENKIAYNEKLTAPISNGDIVGKVNIVDKESDQIIDSANILANNDIVKSDFKDYFKYINNKLLLKI